MKTSALAFLSSLLFSLGAPSGLVSAQAAFERYASELPGFQLELQQRVKEPSEAPHGLFSADLLEESGLTSFSSWKLRRSGKATMVGRVFETNSSIGAYALFNDAAHSPQAGDWSSLELPLGNRFSPSEAVFWRGNFLFHVLPAEGTLEEPVFSDFVKDVAKAIDLENLLPVSVSHLPEQDRLPGSVRFYLGAGSLSQDPAFPDPLLKEIGLSDRIEIATARYLPDDHPLFVVGYPTTSLADQYLIRMQDRLTSYFSDEGIYMKRAGVLIGIFIGPEEQARKVLGDLQYKPTIKWIKKKGPPSDDHGVMAYVGTVTSAILGTGTLLILIIGGGLLAGLARYGLFKAFPSILHRKDTVRLKLR